MSARNGHPRPRDPEEQLADQEEIQAHGAAVGEGIRTAAKEQPQQQRHFLDELSDPEVDSEDHPHLSDTLAPDLSRSHIFANKDEEDIWRHRLLNENQAERMLAEHNFGRLCRGSIRRVALGIQDRPNVPTPEPLTQQEKRLTRSALSVKTARQTLAKGRAGLKAVSEITTATRVDRGDDGDDGGDGRLRRWSSKVFS